MINKILNRFGYSIVKNKLNDLHTQMVPNPVFESIYKQCTPYTLTGKLRMYALFQAVEYIVKSNINGSFVECGVWRGGSAMLTALTLIKHQNNERKLYLYDTFEGMSAPTDFDRDFKGRMAKKILDRNRLTTAPNAWCYADLNDVIKNMNSTRYPFGHIYFIKGKVEETIPQSLPETPIALLHLDTDWYESTKHELNYLFPLLVPNGVIIIDDYGHWEGCRKAVDEYFKDQSILFNRIDYTGILGIKTSAI
jgi:O-methyltransferase